MLSARADWIDVVLGLEAGADDYVTKPFDGAVLVARIRAVLRRFGHAAGPEGTGQGGTEGEAEGLGGVLVFGDLEVDTDGMEVRRAGEQVALTPTEMRLLLEFSSAPGTVLSRDKLLERVWDYGWGGDTRVVDVHVQRLRTRRPGPDRDGPRLGYKSARIEATGRRGPVPLALSVYFLTGAFQEAAFFLAAFFLSSAFFFASEAFLAAVFLAASAALLCAAACWATDWAVVPAARGAAASALPAANAEPATQHHGRSQAGGQDCATDAGGGRADGVLVRCALHTVKSSEGEWTRRAVRACSTLVTRTPAGAQTPHLRRKAVERALGIRLGCPVSGGGSGRRNPSPEWGLNAVLGALFRTWHRERAVSTAPPGPPPPAGPKVPPPVPAPSPSAGSRPVSACAPCHRRWDLSPSDSGPSARYVTTLTGKRNRTPGGPP
ncbi:hypothetical protein SMICM17S_08636 [Streptomyces microflavus]